MTVNVIQSTKILTKQQVKIAYGKAQALTNVAYAVFTYLMYTLDGKEDTHSQQKKPMQHGHTVTYTARIIDGAIHRQSRLSIHVAALIPQSLCPIHLVGEVIFSIIVAPGIMATWEFYMAPAV